MSTEKDLIRRSVRGDTTAFEKLVEMHQNKVYTLCYRYMGNEEDASDMAQEAFVKAYKSLASFKGDSSFGTWLYRVTTNVCLDEIRRRKRRINALSIDEPVETSDGEMEKEIVDTEPLADEVYEQKELAVYIQSILNDMKPEHKSVIVLRDMLDFSYEEIGSILECSVGTVKSRLSRARKMFRQVYKNS